MPKRKRIERAELCPSVATHTREPAHAASYTGWDDWAEAMSITHDQVRCKHCGFYAIWTSKPFPSGRILASDAVRVAEAIAHGLLMPDSIDDVDLPPREKDNLRGLVRFIILSEFRAHERRRHGPAQRNAMALLRSFLTPEQRAQLANRRSFYVTTPAGNTYRLRPKSGSVQHVVRHGKLWIEDADFCYHDPEEKLPKADVTLGHLLLLHNDEARFLAEANRTAREHMGWNGDWLRRVRRRRLRDREIAAGADMTRERLTQIAAEAHDDVAFFEDRLGAHIEGIAERMAAIPA